MSSLRTNFAYLETHDKQLVRLGMLAERYFPDDPNTCLLKLRQLTELLAQLVATKVGLYTSREEAQYDLLRRLQDQGILPRDVGQLFSEVRRAGNAANHAIAGDHRTALSILKITWQLSLWFHRSFGDRAFKSGPFVPPSPPKDESEELRAELATLNAALAEHQAAHQQAAERLASTEAMLRSAKDDQAFWEQMAADAEGTHQSVGPPFAPKMTNVLSAPLRITRWNSGSRPATPRQSQPSEEGEYRAKVVGKCGMRTSPADSSTGEPLAKLFGSLDNLHRAAGGRGLTFKLSDPPDGYLTGTS